MSLSIRRLLLTAIVVLALVAATALYAGYRSGGVAAQSVLEVATTGDLRALLPSHDAPGSAIADLALRRLEIEYYKPIAPQTPLDGERDALKNLFKPRRSAIHRCPCKWRTETISRTALAPPLF